MHAASPATAGMLCGGRQPRLRDEDAHIVDGEVLPPVELVEEVAARAELHDQDEVARCTRNADVLVQVVGAG